MKKRKESVNEREGVGDREEGERVEEEGTKHVCHSVREEILHFRR